MKNCPNGETAPSLVTCYLRGGWLFQAKPIWGCLAIALWVTFHFFQELNQTDTIYENQKLFSYQDQICRNKVIPLPVRYRHTQADTNLPCNLMTLPNIGHFVN